MPNSPTAGRPAMPKDYGIQAGGQGLLPWSHVEERMAEARNYWIATSRPDGRPHVMPVWGVWLDGKLYFGTDRQSRKSRNLERNPSVVVHLESGDDVVIVEGAAAAAGNPAELAAIDDAYQAKYGMRLTGHPGAPAVYSVTPAVVFAWREKDFPVSATRWHCDRQGL